MEGKKKVFEALHNVFKEVKAISKDQKGYQYKYRGIEDCYTALHDLFAKHGLIMTAEMVSEKVTRWWFTSLEDGSQHCTEVPLWNESKSFQQTGMAVSYSQKYALLSVFMIPTVETQDLDSQQNNKEDLKFKQIIMKQVQALSGNRWTDAEKEIAKQIYAKLTPKPADFVIDMVDVLFMEITGVTV